MGKLFCIIGKSSTGKDTIYKEVLEESTLNLRRIVSYTTRPIRAGEHEGLEYHFCTYEKEKELQEEGKIIELRSYNTYYGRWDYFTVDDGQIDFDKSSYLIIGTVESFVKIQDYFGKSRVEPIYIEVEDGQRLMRALQREMQQTSPKYEELCRRYLADAEDFSPEKLKAAGIEKKFYNRDLKETIAEIVEYIKGQI